MIRAYPGCASVLPGERLVLHVATDSRRFRVHFYRWGDGFQAMHSSGWLPGERAPEHGAGDDWRWPAYEFAIPAHWPSAVYIAHLEESGGSQPLSLALDAGAALFVVRSRRSAARPLGMLYKLPLATYHAYNHSGGGCYYDRPPRSLDPPGARVSLQRPGGGIGGPVWGAPDHYDAASPRQTFAHWDARFVRWLARQGHAPDFCTDLDIHHDPGLPLRYRLLVSVGHDEYWTAATRDAVEDFVAAGGNAAFFAANLCWWRVHLVERGTALVCHQGSARGAFDHWWPATGAGRPEEALSGAISVGHDEYWTAATRDAVEDFVAAGGNAAFFAANLCWWRVHLVERGTALVCHQGSARGAFDHWWPATGAGRPEEALSGASYRHGGGWWDGARQTRGFIVQQPEHWVFAGTGLRQGEALGADTWPPLAGYECDGALLDAFDPGSGTATLSAWADESGTPDSYELLAACPLDRRWQELPPRERHAAGEGVHAATMGVFERGGTVFSAGTTDWAQVLADGRDRRVERITRNVLDRLLQ